MEYRGWTTESVVQTVALLTELSCFIKYKKKVRILLYVRNEKAFVETFAALVESIWGVI